MWLLFLWICALPQVSLAEEVAVPTKAEITSIRSGPFVDKAMGKNVMRYVFDVSSPVDADGFVVVGGASPRIAIAIKSAVPAKGVSLVVEDELVSRASYTVNAAGTQVLFELAQKVSASDFKVFTLPGNPQGNKTYRVVVDINRNPKGADQEKTARQPIRGSELLQVRSYTHTDAVTGESKLRMVLDSSVPVVATAALSSSPFPRLIIDVKGAAPGKIDREYEFDGKIVDRAVIMPGDGVNDSRLVVDLPLVFEPGDYKLFTLPGDANADKPFRIVIDINKKLPPMTFKFTSGLADKVIVIDPGHGGSDPGAIGQGGLQEKTVNLAVALQTKVLLQKAGAKVLMTRETDRDVYGPDASDVEELKSRTTIANLQKADVFISIHSNSSANREVSGTSTYFYRKTAYDGLLAQTIQQSLLQAGGLVDRRVNVANFYVTKRAHMPAALIELAFLSNKNEEKLLGSPQFQQQMAQGIVQGLEKFFAQASKQGGDEK
jgi:N-acetylmuramoyl-L-alanine amidase